MQESEILLAQPVADPEGTKSGHGFQVWIKTSPSNEE